MRFAIVPASVVDNDKWLRLDAGHYLGRVMEIGKKLAIAQAQERNVRRRIRRLQKELQEEEHRMTRGDLGYQVHQR
jgi:hypothetical protein